MRTQNAETISEHDSFPFKYYNLHDVIFRFLKYYSRVAYVILYNNPPHFMSICVADCFLALPVFDTTDG